MSDREHMNDDLSLPKATVQKIIAEVIPSDLSFGKDTRDALIECCIEFIMIVTTESNEIAEQESKKTIACEHVLSALKTLGFYEYLAPIKEVIAQHREAQKIRERKVGKLEQSGRSEEDLQREQEMLFGQARSRLQNIQKPGSGGSQSTTSSAPPSASSNTTGNGASSAVKTEELEVKKEESTSVKQEENVSQQNTTTDSKQNDSDYLGGWR